MGKINKRIIWLVTGRFNGYLDDGGTVSGLTLLQQLKTRGANCSIEVISSRGFTKKDYVRLIKGWVRNRKVSVDKDRICFSLRRIPINFYLVKYNIFKLYRKKNEKIFSNLINDIIKKIKIISPDIIFTFQDDIFSLFAASSTNTPHFHTFSSISFKYRPQFFIYRKEFLRAFKNTKVIARDICLRKDIQRLWHRNPFILPPIIEGNSSIVKKRNPRYISFINYDYHKGAVIFKNIARRLPDKNFLLVDNKRLFKPAPWLKNIKVVYRQSDMRRVYAVTKILLVPTLLEQSGQRVIIEAMLNGIPVIANKIPGTENLLSGAGSLIKVNTKDVMKSDYLVNPLYHMRTYLDYIKIIKKIDEKKGLYNRLSIKALERAKRLMSNQGKNINRFINYIL